MHQQHEARLQSQAVDIFALIVLFADDYLSLVPWAVENGHSKRRFLHLSKRLPLELQMVVCLREANSIRDCIKSQDAELAFKKHVSHFSAGFFLRD